MGEISKDDRLVMEEQKILDQLIYEMDKNIKNKTRELKGFISEAKRASGGNTDVIATLGITQQRKKEIQQEIKRAEQTRDELYDHRIKLRMEDQDGIVDEEEYKIGLHTYSADAKIYVMSWKEDIARHYLLGNPSEIYDYCRTLKYGEKFRTQYTLLQKRKVNLRFTKVKSVIQMFPILTEEAEKIIADEFLQELLKRRSSAEFQNIVFSIQKQQGEIIQAPFKQNMIVQGCAGSGKSMIMLHRLPILMYDNPNALNKTNLYIITPSKTYIQMANKMRHQLEIEDLNMGTLKQYFDYCIEKYGRNSKDYGKYNPFIHLDSEKEQYIYSEKCKNEIISLIENEISTDDVELQTGYSKFQIQKRTGVVSNYADKALQFMLNLQSIITANDNVLKTYFVEIKKAVSELDMLYKMLYNRKNNALRECKKLKSRQEVLIKQLNQEIEKLDSEKNAIAIQNRKNIIAGAEQKIKNVIIQMRDIEENQGYFDKLAKISEMINQMMLLYEDLDKEYEKNDYIKIYECIHAIPEFIEKYYFVFYELEGIEDVYEDLLDSIDMKKMSVTAVMEELEELKIRYLREAYYSKLIQKRKDWGDPFVNVPLRVYAKLLSKIGIEEEKGKLPAISCSPYLYLQILYQYRGRPKASSESLITIDEAQGVSKEELLLIKHINNDKVIFNLFGDEKQHIEGTKGIDSWTELEDITPFKRYTMVENYRNARQITDYCNKRFHFEEDMRAINLDGAGVHEVYLEDEFKLNLVKQFTTAKQGTCAIIVKDKYEAKYIMKSFSNYGQKIHDLTGEEFEPHHSRWNLITIEEAKGLEFGSVFAISGRMSMNEKYISYTRALDELIVYDEEIDLPEWVYEEKQEEAKNEKCLNKDRSNSKSQTTELLVKQYFINAGLQVVDWREKTGELWVVGGKRQIGKTIDSACEKFQIKGQYAISNATGMKPGWVTKM